MRRRDVLAGGVAQSLVLGGCASLSGDLKPPPLVIAHRGASGERPEHTLAAYRLAITQGADYIEPDLVMTKDNILVCRHENEISGTTDVADHAEFADRRKAKSIDGVEAQGWWVEDFTLGELKTLRAKERLPQLRPNNTQYDGQEEIPTFAEVLALAQQSNVGVYPELKHPTLLREQGVDPVPAFIAAVHAAGGQRAADRMFVQCFEVGALATLAQMSSLRFSCIQLIAADGGPWDQRPRPSADMISDRSLQEIAGYARGIGVEKSLIIPRDASGASLPRTDLIERAHRAGLLVHAWTFRAENYFLPTELRRAPPGETPNPTTLGDLANELQAFYAAGIDGVFSDFPGIATTARLGP
jgi:glycerophosphoryl diester phosphodiesterase